MMSAVAQREPTNIVAIDKQRDEPSLIKIMANQYSMEAKKFASTVKSTCMPKNASDEQFAAFLLVANKYRLNPITKEIYAFPTRGGGIQPIVGIDGWMNLINSHPDCDGMVFVDTHNDDGALTAITCRIYRKDRSHPTEVTEYMDECRVDNSQPWQKWPARMLRHKAAIQCARYAFGFAGIIDPDEAERSPDVIDDEVVEKPVTRIAPPPPSMEVIEADEVAFIQEPEANSQFYEELEVNLQAAKDIDDVEQIWADMDVARICADDMDVADKIKNKRLRELEAA